MVWLKIEEVAKRSGLTKRTIRYYEELGILAPPERSEGKIRLYTEEHIETLQKIVNAKEVLGFSLQELQQFIVIGNTIESQCQDYKLHYKNTADQMERRNRLLEIDKHTGEQLDLIAQKIQKIHRVQTDLENMRIRVQMAIAEIEEGRK
jgi:MerR family transcriptional regulator, repressor of the yfmOP operon